MPTTPCIGNCSTENVVEDSLDPGVGQHRCKVLQAHLHPVIHAPVARPVGRKEIGSNPDAQKSIDIEQNNLESKRAWDYNTVREWLQVVREAKSRGEKVHVGKMFEICVEEGSELQKGNLFASSTVGPCFRETTWKTKMQNKLYLQNLDRLLPPWKRPRPLMLMRQCLGIAHNSMQGHQNMCAPPQISLAKMLGLEVQRSGGAAYSTVTRIRGVYGKSVMKI